VVEPGGVEVREVDVAEPGPGEIQVELAACGICTGDRYLFQGQSTVKTMPYRFGHEGAGTIRAVGDNVAVPGVEPGRKVFCAGGGNHFQRVVNLRPGHIGLLPDDADLSTAIGEPVLCVVNGLEAIRLSPGQRVAVVGAGYMGLLHVLGLAASLVGELVVFDINEQRRSLAAACGADTVVDAADEAACVEYHRHFDVVVEAAGAQGALDLATKLVRKGGTISAFSWHRGERTIHGPDWHLTGFTVLNTSPAFHDHYADLFPQVARLLGRGFFPQEKLITHRAPLEDAQGIFETAWNQSDGYVKGVVTM
jgi:L-iditol 2-dehydrogenase